MAVSTQCQVKPGDVPGCDGTKDQIVYTVDLDGAGVQYVHLMIAVRMPQSPIRQEDKAFLFNGQPDSEIPRHRNKGKLINAGQPGIAYGSGDVWADLFVAAKDIPDGPPDLVLRSAFGDKDEHPAASGIRRHAQVARPPHQRDAAPPQDSQMLLKDTKLRVVFCRDHAAEPGGDGADPALGAHAPLHPVPVIDEPPGRRRAGDIFGPGN